MFLFSYFLFAKFSSRTVDRFSTPDRMIRRDLSTFSFNAGCWMGYCAVIGVHMSSPCQSYNGTGFPGKVRWDKSSIGQLSARQCCFLSQRVAACIVDLLHFSVYKGDVHTCCFVSNCEVCQSHWVTRKVAFLYFLYVEDKFSRIRSSSHSLNHSFVASPSLHQWWNLPVLMGAAVITRLYVVFLEYRPAWVMGHREPALACLWVVKGKKQADCLIRCSSNESWGN